MPQAFLLLLLLIGSSFAASPNEAPAQAHAQAPAQAPAQARSLIDPLLPPVHHFPVKPITPAWPQQPKPEHPSTPATPAAPQKPAEPATKEEPAKDEPATKDEPASPEDVQKGKLKCLKLISRGTFTNVTAEPACAQVVKACEADYKRFCGARNGKKFNPDRKMNTKCLRRHGKELSEECLGAFATLIQATIAQTPCDADFKANCPANDKSCLPKRAKLSENCKNWLATNELGKRRSSNCWVLWVLVVLGFLALYVKLRMGCMQKEAEAEAKQAQAGMIELVAQHPKQEESPTAWACESCTLQNAANDTFCTACGTSKPASKMTPFAMPMMAPAMMTPAMMPPVAASARPTLYPAVYADAVPAYSMPAYTPTLVQYPTLKPIQQ